MDYVHLLFVKTGDNLKHVAEFSAEYGPKAGDIVSVQFQTMEKNAEVLRVLFCRPTDDEYAFISAMETIYPATAWWSKQETNLITNIQEEKHHV